MAPRRRAEFFLNCAPKARGKIFLTRLPTGFSILAIFARELPTATDSRGGGADSRQDLGRIPIPGINTENYYFSLFFPIFSLKNKEKYQFSIYLQLKLIKIIIKHFLFINIEKKSRILQAVTRLENNSLLSKPILWNKDKMPGYRF